MPFDKSPLAVMSFAKSAPRPHFWHRLRHPHIPQHIVIAAMRWTDVARVMAGLPAWNGRIVIDGTNPVEFIDPNGPDANDPANPLAAYGIRVGGFGRPAFQRGLPAFGLAAVWRLGRADLCAPLNSLSALSRCDWLGAGSEPVKPSDRHPG